MHDALLHDADLIVVVVLVEEVLQQEKHLVFVCPLVHGQEVVTDGGGADLQFFWALGVLV